MSQKRVPCDLPKSKGGINFLDLKALALARGLTFPSNITKRQLCDLVNKSAPDASGLDVTDPHDLAAEYNMVRKLGSGAFGDVWLAIEKASGNKYALKLLREINADVKREVESMIELSRVNKGGCSSNIVCYYDQFTSTFKNKVYHVIKMELIDGQTLEDWRDEWYENNANPPPTKLALKLATNIFSGLAEMHSARLYHLDIKPSNIMIRASNNEAVIVDLGLSCSQKRSKVEPNTCAGTDGWGTRLFMSPEYMKHCYLTDTYSAQCNEKTRAGTDVWAAGLSLLSAVFNPDPLDKIREEIGNNADYVQWLSKESWLPRTIHRSKLVSDVIKGALQPTENRRPTAQQLLKKLGGK